MKLIDAITVERKGGYGAYLWGQPDDHVMDWNGCNYRSLSLTRKRFTAREEAEAYILDRFPSWQHASWFAQGKGDGSFMGRDFGDFRDMKLPR